MNVAGLMESVKKSWTDLRNKQTEDGVLTFLNKTVNRLDKVLTKIDDVLKRRKIDVKDIYTKTKDNAKNSLEVAKELINQTEIKNKTLSKLSKLKEPLAKIKDKFKSTTEKQNGPPNKALVAVTDFLSSFLTSKNKEGKKQSPVERLKELFSDTIGKTKEQIENNKPKEYLKRMNDSFSYRNKKSDEVKKEIEDEKKRSIENLAKPAANKKSGSWIGKILGGIYGAARFLVGGFGSLLFKLIKPLTTSIGSVFASVIGSAFKGLPGMLLRGGGLLGRAGLALGGMAIRTGLTAGASLIGGIISSPIALGAIAVGGLAYGGYKLYKYLNRNNVSDDAYGYLTKLRLKQYGLDESKQNDYYRIFELEMALKDYIVYKDGRVYLKPLDKDIKEKITDIFNISSKDQEYKNKVSILNTWLNKRFLPVVKTHILSIKIQDDSLYLDDIEKIRKTDLINVYDKLIIPTDIYDCEQVPTFNDTKIYITKEQIDKYSKEVREYLASLSTGNKDTVKKIKADNPAEKEKTETKQPTKTPTELTNTTTTTTQNKIYTGEAETQQSPARQSVSDNQNGVIGNLNKAGGELVSGDGSLTGIQLDGISEDKIHNLDPDVKRLFTGMAKEYNQLTNKKIPVRQAFRTFEEQKKLYQTKPKGQAAPPGFSTHEFGLALDISSVTANELDKLGLMRKYGFTRPVGGEAWHIEPIGVSLDPETSKKDKERRRIAIQNSVGRGGGGIGGDKGYKLGTRNIELQKSIYKTTTDKEVDVNKILSKDSSVNLDNTKPQISNPITDKRESQQIDKPTITTKTENKQPQVNKEVKQEVAKPFDSKVASVYDYKVEEKTPALDIAKYKTMTKEQAIKRAAENTGVSESVLTKFAELESSGNPNAKAKTSSATGLFQFTDGTWKYAMDKYAAKYKIPNDADPTNPYYSAVMTGAYINDNLKQIDNRYKQIGLDETTAAYLAHHYGPSGASNIIKSYIADPEQKMRSVVSDSVYTANRSAIGDKSLKQYLEMLGMKVSSASQNKQQATTNIPEQANTLLPVTQDKPIKTKPYQQPSYVTDDYNAVVKDKPKLIQQSTENKQPSNITIDTKSMEALLSNQLIELKTIVTVLKTIDGKIKITNDSPQENKQPENKTDVLKDIKRSIFEASRSGVVLDRR